VALLKTVDSRVEAASAPLDSPADRALQVQEAIRSIFDFVPATLAGHTLGMGVVTFLYWGSAPSQTLTTVWLAFTLVMALRLKLFLSFRRSVATTQDEWQRWGNLGKVGSLASGAAWGAAAWLMYTHGNHTQQTGLIVIIYTYCIAGIPVLSTQPKTLLAFTVLCGAPLVSRIIMDGNLHSYKLAGMLLLIVALTTVLARTYRQTVERVISLKRQSDTLLAQLRVEKKIADTARQQADIARQEAEVANRAKTQFFTAASHDLRQPLHAMGLFAEALRQKSHDQEVSQLVNSINSSVDALEGLFSELLDITRIDTGGVEVKPAHFAVADILRKLRLHFEPNAFEKGLALRFRGMHHLVFADPLLVERILRNLVSNAIRYTDDGTVLVSARRRGQQVLLQVWDTGQGIPLNEQQHIFEEFYQLATNRSSSIEQRKGLGLGLAIVKRLAGLMNAPLTLRSEPGRGTVFSLHVPRGERSAVQPHSNDRKGPLGITLEGRLIVVVEDEPAVRGGLEALLKGWGAALASFDSVAAASEWATSSNPEQAKPDLLIVDYRLENGQTGVQAIDLLRTRFGPELPAIVVTGSTMTGHEKEALDHNFHLLIKPVVPNKLRAMIAFKLSMKSP
jgi:two-component system, sensor histidine kinase